MVEDIKNRLSKLERKVKKDNLTTIKEISKLKKHFPNNNKGMDIKKYFFKIIPYLFLFLLLVIALNQFFKWEFVTEQMTRLVILTIISGGLTFWRNRNKINFDLDKEKKEEDFKEMKRKKEFSSKFPRINKIPIIRNFVKWMYKESWWYSITAILLIIIGFAIRLYHLSKLSLWWDELITGMYVSRILEVGLPLFPSELGYYWRGIIYHYIVSLFTFIFGNTEFWLRFPSVLFGMGIVIISFIFAKKINKWAGLLVLLFLTFSTYNIEYSRFARFYIMNAFLFMLSLLFIYKGLFLKQIKYLWISLILFIFMVHTVQLGSFYVFAIGTYIIYSSIFIFFNKNNTSKRDSLKIFLFILASTLIALIGNFFGKFTWLINKISGKEIYAYQLLENIPKPVTYPLIKLPEWVLFSFFNQYYIPIIFILIALILSFFIFLNDIKFKRTLSWFNYITITLFISIIGYEIVNRNVGGARIFLFVEGIYVIVVVSLIVILFKHLFRKDLLYKISSLMMVVLLLISITPYFYERINVDYGDNVSNDPFRTTHVAAYRADYKTTYEFLKKNIREEDIWINVMGSNYFVFNRSPDYILNQNFRWNTMAILDNNGNLIDRRTGAILINSPSDIKRIINNNSNRKIWLLVNGGSINILSTTHVRQNFIDFLNENKDKIVFSSEDKNSEIYLFN